MNSQGGSSQEMAISIKNLKELSLSDIGKPLRKEDDGNLKKTPSDKMNSSSPLPCDSQEDNAMFPVSILDEIDSSSPLDCGEINQVINMNKRLKDGIYSSSPLQAQGDCAVESNEGINMNKSLKVFTDPQKPWIELSYDSQKNFARLPAFVRGKMKGIVNYSKKARYVKCVGGRMIPLGAMAI